MHAGEERVERFRQPSFFVFGEGGVGEEGVIFVGVMRRAVASSGEVTVVSWPEAVAEAEEDGVDERPIGVHT